MASVHLFLEGASDNRKLAVKRQEQHLGEEASTRREGTRCEEAWFGEVDLSPLQR